MPANILIKNREGRPIKVEKNSLADDSMSANARVHAWVLDLYDNTRLAQPMKENYLFHGLHLNMKHYQNCKGYRKKKRK
jgi:hypothetical protein